MQPQHGALYVEESTLQTISIPQVDSSHPRSPPSIISLIIALDSLLPEVPYAAITALTKADIDQEVAELVIRLKVGSRLR